MIIQYNSKDRYDGHVTYGKKYLVLCVHKNNDSTKFIILSDSIEAPILVDHNEVLLIEPDIPFDWTLILDRTKCLVTPRALSHEIWGKIYMDDENSKKLLDGVIKELQIFHNFFD